MGFFELDDVFTYQDANDIKKLWASDTAPASPGTGEVWLDTSSIPYKLKRYNGTNWRIIDGITNNGKCVDISDSDLNNVQETGFYMGENVTNAPNTSWYYFIVLKKSDSWFLQIALKANLNTPAYMRAYWNASWVGWYKLIHEGVDGSGSGLDADLLDGLESGSFLRNDTNDSFSGTLTSTKANGAVIKFDNGDSCITVHDGNGNFNLKAGVDENHEITVSDGGSHIELSESGTITIAVSGNTVGSTFTDDMYIKVSQSGVTINGQTVWHAGNDGSGSGLDADKLDGQEGSYYRNANNLNAGTVSRARLTNLWYDNDYDTNENVFIQTGSKYCTVSGTIVFFDHAFSEIPRVVGIPTRKDRGVAYITGRTTTSFKGWTSEIGGAIDWIAIGRKD